MRTFAAAITDYLAQYRQGRIDDAFHGLLELDHEVLTGLEAAFRASTDQDLRGFLLHVIWQHRQQSVIPLLREALLDSEPRVWREALDGLVTLASPASVEALHAAREQRRGEDFHRRLEEAIEQAAEAEVERM